MTTLGVGIGWQAHVIGHGFAQTHTTVQSCICVNISIYIQPNTQTCTIAYAQRRMRQTTCPRTHTKGSERVLFVRYEDLKRGLGAQVNPERAITL